MIKQNKSLFKNRKKGMVIVAVVLLMGVFLLSSIESKPDAVIESKARTVKTVTAKVGEISSELTVNGFSNETYTDLGYNQIQGKVEEICVKVGDRVSQGEVLFKIDQTQNIVQMELQRTELQLKITELEILLRQTGRQKNKFEVLFRGGAIAESELRTVLDEEERINNQKEQLQNQIGQLTDKIGELKKLGNVIATVDGVVTKIEMKIGSYLTEKNYIRLEKIEEPEITINVTESNLPYFEVGKTVKIVIPSKNSTYSGVVKERLPGGGTAMLYPVKISVKTTERLDGGLSVKIISKTYQNSEAILVPCQSVIKFNGESFLYVVESDKIARKRLVTVGISEAGIQEILMGVIQGEKVITSGNLNISDNEEVLVVQDEL